MSLKHKLALEASAGSGKTFALSVRYIALLLQGADPARIVALTFTKKAANEMKERVYETLEGLEQRKAELKSLCELLECSQEEVLLKRDKILPSFLNAAIHIETIDAFLGKILRKFSLHLGIMPDFVTESAAHEKHLLTTFLQTLKREHTYAALVRFLAVEKMRLQDLVKLFDGLYEKNSELDAFLYERSPSPSGEEALAKAKEIYCLLEKTNVSKRGLNQFYIHTTEVLCDKTFWKQESLNYWDFRKIYTPELDDLFCELKALFHEFTTQKEAYLLGELFAFYRAYEKTRLKLATEKGELTFTDVANFVHRLLHGSIDSDFLYFRLDAVIEHLLIDEFQDTNAVQFEILSPLIEEIVSGEGTHGLGSFFYVGDTKQSIYRFRGGTKELFKVASERFDVDIEALEMNYRSERVVVDFVNDVFSASISGYIPQKVAKEEVLGYVEVSVNEDALEGLLASVKNLLDHGVSADDMAILCWTNDDINTIESALLETFDSLHVSTESSLLLTHSPIVRTVIEYVRYCYFGAELLGRNTQVLRGSSWEKPLEKISIDWARPLAQTIKHIIEKLCLDGTDADLIRLMEVADNYRDVEAFLFELERISERSCAKSGQGVRVLTVHKSKGLEFDYVLLADRLKADSNRKPPLLFEYEGVELQHLYYRMKNREFMDEDYERAKEKENLLGLEDRLNALYVAFTRAKKGLLLPMKKDKSVCASLGLDVCQKGRILSSKHEELISKARVDLMLLPHLGRQHAQKSEEDEIAYTPEAIHFGRALHYALEMLPGFTQEGLSHVHTAILNRYGGVLSAVALKDVMTRVKRLLEDEHFHSLVDGGHLFKEQPLMFEGERKQIDLLIEHEDRVIIIDYKSSENLQQEHCEQVLLYKKAMEDIYKKRVEAWLFYLRKDGIESKNLQFT